MNFEDISRYRLASQGFLKKFKTPEEAVRVLGAVQAQEFQGGMRGIGLRMQDATQNSIEQAVNAGTIIRTWPMRGTIHFVTSDDIRWMVELMAPRMIKKTASYYRRLELTDALLKKSRQIIVKALSGGKHITRPALYSLLENKGIQTGAMRGLFILGYLAGEGLICFGRREGKQPTFTLLSEWAPRAKSLSRDMSLAEITRRYFTGHGPATVYDLMWWSGLNLSEVKHGLKLAGSDLRAETVNGKTYYLAKNAGRPKSVTGDIFLLPTYDEYLIAYKDRTASLSRDHFNKFISAPNMVFNSVIMYKGKAIGAWRKNTGKGKILITAKPFLRFTGAQLTALKRAVKEFSRFHKIPAELSI